MREMHKERNTLYYMLYNVFYPCQININMSISLTGHFNPPKSPDLYAVEGSLPVSFVKICYHFLPLNVFAIKK